MIYYILQCCLISFQKIVFNILLLNFNKFNATRSTNLRNSICNNSIRTKIKVCYYLLRDLKTKSSQTNYLWSVKLLEKSHTKLKKDDYIFCCSSGNIYFQIVTIL